MLVSFNPAISNRKSDRPSFKAIDETKGLEYEADAIKLHGRVARREEPHNMITLRKLQALIEKTSDTEISRWVVRAKNAVQATITAAH